MNFLFVKTKHSIYDIASALQRMNHNVIIYDETDLDPLSITHQNAIDQIERLFQQQTFDYVITYLFIPELSNLCNRLQIIYISWIYDSPHISLFHESIYNACNRVFLFDFKQYERLLTLNVPHIYHLPLAADCHRSSILQLSRVDREKYSCDISFVGTMYEDNLYNACRGLLPEMYMLPINQSITDTLYQWGTIRTWPDLSDDMVHVLTDVMGYHSDACDYFAFPISMYLGNLMISRKQAEIERITALHALNEVTTVDVYTGSHLEQLDGLQVHDPIDYYMDLGKIYQCSKINLNFTLPSIESGVPQRVFDVLSYGGFLMTNDQLEIRDYFTPDKDFVVFHNLNELKELAAYYLSHDDERLRIANHGRQTVLNHYTYEIVLSQVLDICRQ